MEEITCPKCQSTDVKAQKSWIMKNPKGKTKTKVTIYFCRECGHKFRKGERLREA